jgi:hypothetical protein
MKSATLPSFWEQYRAMSPAVRARARKAYRLWEENPFHPSLYFKCIDSEEDIWSVRVTKSYRAVGVLSGDTVTWFWIGDHDAYKAFYS